MTNDRNFVKNRK